MLDTLKIDIAQISPRPGDINHNLNTAMEYMEKSSAEGIKLVVFPEMYISGYSVIGSCSKEDFKKISVSINDLLVSKLIKLCSKLDEYIIVGLPLRDESNDTVYNAALFLGPDGIIGIHRKITLPNGNYRGQKFYEGEYFKPGRNISTFKTSIGAFGIFICYELFMPEIPRILAVQGAEYLVCLAAGPMSQKKAFDMFLPVRAIENSAYLIFCNLPREGNMDFFGSSRILMPNGRILEQAAVGDEDRMTGEINSTEVGRARLSYPNLKDRKALNFLNIGGPVKGPFASS
jgi:predicted amidohydrolase